MPGATSSNHPRCSSVLGTFLALGLAACLTATTAAQTVLYVDDDAPNDPGPGDPLVSDPNEDGSSAHPFDAIQEGIDAADPWSNNTVVVLDGTYAGPGNVWLDFGGKAITVRSQNGPEACIIDCGVDEIAVAFDEYENGSTVLEGFTITNADALGCGIACGGYGFSSSPTISRCIFYDNYVGVRVNVGLPTITNCLFYGNNIAVATSWQAPAAQFELVNCTVTDNGLGVVHDADTTTAWIRNCIVWGNGLGPDDDVRVSPSATLLVYFSDIPGYPSNGNIDADPLFTNPTLFMYQLSYDSPCVDSGADGYVHTAYDLAGLPRIIGPRVDMGAYEMCGPRRAINPSPSDGATDVLLGTDLGWSDGGGATSYDVYLGEVNPPGPGQFMGNQPGTSYAPGCLVPSTTYFWRVDAKNSCGTTTGDVWSFGTESGPPPSSNVKYVNATATGLNDGSSWRNAFTRLQDACKDYDNAEIWVAAGTYRPDRDAAHPNGSGDRTATFRLYKSVIFYGGFAGCETSLNQRNPTVNVTILSGDLAGNDGPNFANNGENSYHVVATDCVFTGLIGFIVSGGNANGSSSNGCGGGMLIENADPAKPVVAVDCTFTGNSGIYGGAMHNANGSPYVTNCTFTGNLGYGGGVYNTSGSPTLFNCVFSGNSSGWHGGGMLNYAGSPVLTNCTFSGNSAPAGGGITTYGGGSPTLTNCTFSGNSGDSGGGGMYNSSSSTLTNCTFSGNSALTNGYGGGMFNSGGSMLANCTFSGNSATYGGGMSNYGSGTSTLANCIVWGNTASTGSQISGSATVTYSCVQGGWAGTGNIGSDPRLLSDLRLRRGSPCIDAGNNTAVSGITTDLGGNPRFVDDPDTPDTGSGTAPLVDMGAYEYQPVAAKWLYVNGSAASGGNGLSWATAYQYLQDALTAARVDPAVTEIWMAAGTYKPDRDATHPGGTGSRTVTFQLMGGVSVRGGFAGDEDPATFNLGDRDLVAHASVLSGDLAGDDGANFANNGENSYHVVTANSVGPAAVLDGFTISGGNANGSSPNNSGGGLYNSGGSPTLANCTFSGNLGYGGGVYNTSGSPTLTNCTFSGNSSGWHGAGMLNYAGSSVLTNCTFSGNSAGAGGGISNFPGGTPTLTNCTFSGNSGGSGGGGVYNSGSPTLTNCTFSGNLALANGYGGGLYNGGVGTSTLANCTLSGNSATNGGGMRNDSGGTSTLANCILWGNTASSGLQISGNVTVTYSCVQGGYTGAGNISSDPLFVNGASGNLRLQAGSPCIDAANNAAVPVGVTTDLDGYPRFLNDPATTDCPYAPGTCGTAPIVDMGAYEFLPAIPGDYDHDGDVDLADYDLFAACLNGPGSSPASGCTVNADLDADTDVDLGDFAFFQLHFGEPG